MNVWKALNPSARCCVFLPKILPPRLPFEKVYDDTASTVSSGDRFNEFHARVVAVVRSDSAEHVRRHHTQRFFTLDVLTKRTHSIDQNDFFSNNTQDLPAFIAKESRSYVIAACGFMCATDLPEDTPNRAEILAGGDNVICNGGSTIVAPDGTYMVEPVVNEEALIVAVIDHALVRGERQNLDLTGHYARPDVLQIEVNRVRQTGASFKDS